MTEHDKDKHLDELLDSALSTYSSAEPRLGLETRILANLRDAAGTAASPWRNFKWLWAGAAAAVAVLLIAFLLGRRSQIAPPANNVVRTQPPAQPAPQVHSSMPVTAGNAAGDRPKMRASLHPQSVALTLAQRPQVFPTPTPLSEQERLLLSYYARTPREELIAQSHPDEPPAIADDESALTVPDLVLVPQKSSNTR